MCKQLKNQKVICWAGCACTFLRRRAWARGRDTQNNRTTGKPRGKERKKERYYLRDQRPTLKMHQAKGLSPPFHSSESVRITERIEERAEQSSGTREKGAFFYLALEFALQQTQKQVQRGKEVVSGAQPSSRLLTNKRNVPPRRKKTCEENPPPGKLPMYMAKGRPWDALREKKNHRTTKVAK